jgi:hypothetical protein
MPEGYMPHPAHNQYMNPIAVVSIPFFTAFSFLIHRGFTHPVQDTKLIGLWFLVYGLWLEVLTINPGGWGCEEYALYWLHGCGWG